VSRKPKPAKGIGKDIRDARNELGWTQHKLATEAQVSRPTIARVEIGNNISTGTLEKVVKALDKQLRIDARHK
jgi:predicted transcriptional regulator